MSGHSLAMDGSVGMASANNAPHRFFRLLSRIVHLGSSAWLFAGWSHELQALALRAFAHRLGMRELRIAWDGASWDHAIVLRESPAPDSGFAGMFLVPGAAAHCDTSGWDRLLRGLNRYRDRVARQLPYPVLLLLPARVYERLPVMAPDLWSVRSLEWFFPPLSDDPSPLLRSAGLEAFAWADSTNAPHSPLPRPPSLYSGDAALKAASALLARGAFERARQVLLAQAAPRFMVEGRVAEYKRAMELAANSSASVSLAGVVSPASALPLESTGSAAKVSSWLVSRPGFAMDRLARARYTLIATAHWPSAQHTWQEIGGEAWEATLQSKQVMEHDVKQRYSHVVVTTGISLFSTFNVFGSWAREHGLFRFERFRPLPVDGITEEASLAAWRRACEKADITLASQQPDKVSAEFSLLVALKKQGRLQQGARVDLVHTGTLGGRAAVILLSRLLRAHFDARVNLVEVQDFDIDDRELTRRALGDFMGKVADALNHGIVGSTCFAPVGGYKIMTSLGYLAGAWYGFPTAYLHETGQVLHEVPAVPIAVDRQQLRALAPVMRCVGYGETWGVLSREQKDLVSRNSWLFERYDDLVAVNALGFFLSRHSSYAHIFAPKVLVSRQVEHLLRRRAGDRAFILNQARNFARKLDDGVEDSAFRHETDFKVRNPTAFLYRGADGNPCFRATYHFDSHVGRLDLHQVWLDHEAYAREAAKVLERPPAPATLDISGQVFPAPEQQG